MKTFKQQPVRQNQTVGEKIRAARHAKGVTLDDLAIQLKISKKYLDALERGAYNELPSPVYIKNYLRVYTKELQIPWERIQEQLDKEISVFHGPSTGNTDGPMRRKKKQPLGTSAGAHRRRPLIIPRLVKVGIWGIVVLLILVYFGFEVVQLLSPPDLTISYPEEDLIVSEHTITVIGQTDPEAVVEINTQQVNVDREGHFEESITLHQGLNTLQITARSKRSRERMEVRHILYKSE